MKTIEVEYIESGTFVGGEEACSELTCHQKLHVIAEDQKARAERAEVELATWKDLRDVSTQMVPGEHGEGEEIDPTPNSIRDHLKYLQEEWDGAERNLGKANRELSASKAEVERLRTALTWISSQRANRYESTVGIICNKADEALAKTGGDRE